MFGVCDTANDGGVSSPIELPEDIFERVSALCLALPEVTVRVDASLTTFYAPRAGGDRIGVRLTDETDWEEIRELVTESSRRLAPRKLTALLDRQPGQ
jgi:hypothetical protein